MRHQCHTGLADRCEALNPSQPEDRHASTSTRPKLRLSVNQVHGSHGPKLFLPLISRGSVGDNLLDSLDLYLVKGRIVLDVSNE